MTKITKKDKRRVLIWSLLIVIIISYIGVFSFNYWSKIMANRQAKTDLEKQYNRLLAEEEQLNDEIKKLQDPEYVAQYAREKYGYSKEGEIKIQMAE